MGPSASPPEPCVKEQVRICPRRSTTHPREKTMGTTLLSAVFLLSLLDDPAETPRKANPLAPSLRQLSDDEENQLDEIIDRFIQYDTGKLHGSEAKQALGDFQKLGPDAIPALVRGMNRAARIDHSCPAVTIAKKLARMLRSSRDPQLLEFVRENVGAGISQSRHMGVIKELRLTCMLRKRAIAQEVATAERNAPTLSGDSTAPVVKENDLRKLDITQLVEAAGKESGPRLKLVLTELGRRHGDEVIGGLGSAASTYEGDTQRLARDLLTRQLSDLGSTALKQKLKDDRAEVRAAAARAVAGKGLHFERTLLDLLTDEESSVRQAGHDALVRLCKGQDFGPKPDATEAEQKQAAAKWRSWLDKQNGR